jgi:hypothetical protein
MSGKVLSHLFKPGNTSQFTSKERTDLTTTSGLLFLFEIKKSLSYWKDPLARNTTAALIRAALPQSGHKNRTPKKSEPK